jgi:hypothetical protein
MGHKCQRSWRPICIDHPVKPTSPLSLIGSLSQSHTLLGRAASTFKSPLTTIKSHSLDFHGAALTKGSNLLLMGECDISCAICGGPIDTVYVSNDESPEEERERDYDHNIIGEEEVKWVSEEIVLLGYNPASLGPTQ